MNRLSEIESAIIIQLFFNGRYPCFLYEYLMVEEIGAGLASEMLAKHKDRSKRKIRFLNSLFIL
ncbi:MAG: hypothetical protein DDT40_01270 [candidate division WS2 bacterium]|nr:hypothetical protein [Candidatus Psychracetigena formicireducens]